MLGKLIKYEFKATAKIILLFYAALIVVAVINYFVMPWTDTGESLNSAIAFGSTLGAAKTVLQGLLMVMYVLFSIATVMVSMVVIVIRFYKLLGDEGYLMFTLPVTTSQHIISKLIVGVVWNLLSILIVGISAMIVIGRASVFGAIADLWRSTVAWGFSPGLWLFCIMLCVFLYVVSGILQFYTAISIGPHITKSRIGGSIIAYIIIYIAMQVVSTIGTMVMMLFLSDGMFTSVQSADDMVHQVNYIATGHFLLLAGISLAVGIACYVITHRMIDRKLNLG
jgi:hypothetical protein